MKAFESLPSFPSFIILIVAFVVLLFLVFITSYVKAPPDMAFIISGVGKRKILIGRAGFCIPFLNRLDKLLLRQVSVDIKTNGYIPTSDFIGVDIDAIAKVAVMSDKEMVKVPDKDGDHAYPEGDPLEGKRYKLVPGIDLAMKNFLNMKEEQIVKALTDSLQGNMREIIGQMPLRVISSDRKAFGDQVQEKAQIDMNNLGIRIISCNIQKVADEHNLINDLGQDNMAKIKKDAAIAKAEADRDIAIRQAETKRESNEAEVAANLVIAQKNNELAIRVADLKKVEEAKRAEAEAAYNIENQVQMKRVNTETVNAQIAQAEREADLRERQVAIKERELEADIMKKAEAERYEAEQKAQAVLIKRQKDAEAAKFEQERQAEAKKAMADAARYEAEQRAAGIRITGDAEAAAIEAKGVAEANAMERKAIAYQKYNGAAMAEMMIKIMPQMAAEIAKPLGQIDKINIYGGGNDSNGLGTTQISGTLPVVMKQVFDTMSEATGVDFSEIMKAGTYDAKVTRNINVSGISGQAAENVVCADAVQADPADADNVVPADNTAGTKN